MLRTLFLTIGLALMLAGTAPRPAAAGERDNNGDPGAPFLALEQLDPERYAGRWYEIARFPNRHQRHCAAITAEYATRRDGNFDVRGICPDRRPGRNGRQVEGVARLDGPAELSLGATAWMPVFRRSVFVLYLSRDDQIAVLGEPRRKYGWIMARSPTITPAQFDSAAAVLLRNGYFIELLELVSGTD